MEKILTLLIKSWPILADYTRLVLILQRRGWGKGRLFLSDLGLYGDMRKQDEDWRF